VRIAACCLALQVTLLAAFPAHDGYVNDFASVLADSDETYLEDYLRTLERDTSAEVAIATVNSLDGMTVEEYANRLFVDWGIGKKQKDNGVLLLVSMREKAVRIEVGYGLEPIIPDGRAGEIIRTSIVPDFRDGNFPRGIGQGIERIARIIRERGEPTSPLQSAVPQVVRERSSVPVALIAVPFMGLFVAIAAFFAGTGISTRTVGPIAFAALFGGIPLALATAFLSWWWVALLLLFGGVVMAFGHRVGRSPYWLGMLRKGKEDAQPADGSMPWIMGATSDTTSSASSDAGGSSSSFDSSSSSSSSSDFGGGSSGGGGASGSWQ
jgi:uncharacterized protein